MKCEWIGSLHMWWIVTELEDRIDATTATDDEVMFHRFLVNAAKYANSLRATQVVRDGIEVLGGNGTIEDFSALPRLYRHAIVYESWEGTHNVLVAQVLRDLRHFDTVGVVAERLDALVASAASPVTSVVADAAEQARARAESAIKDPAFGAQHFRAVLDDWLLAFRAASLLAAGPGTEEEAAGELLALRGLDPGYHALDDSRFSARVDSVLRADLEQARPAEESITQ